MPDQKTTVNWAAVIAALMAAIPQIEAIIAAFTTTPVSKE